jgi:hypothetical protein
VPTDEADTAATVSPGQLILPGDRINGMLVTKGEGDFPFIFHFPDHCTREGSEVACTFAAGTDVGVSYGFYGDNAADLDWVWSTVEYEMVLEDRPVNLDAFGTIDLDHPDGVRVMRAWNVVLADTKPGTITARHRGEVVDETFADTMEITFASE